MIPQQLPPARSPATQQQPIVITRTPTPAAQQPIVITRAPTPVAQPIVIARTPTQPPVSAPVPVTVQVNTADSAAIETETKRRLDEAVTDNAGLKQIISNLQQRQDELTAELDELQRAGEELTSIATESRQREEQLQASIEAMQLELNTSQQNIQELLAEREAYQNQLADLQSQRQQLQDQIQATAIEREQLSTDLMAMNIDLSNERQSRSIEIAAFNEARDDLMQQIEGQRQQLVDLSNEEQILQQAQLQCTQTLAATNDQLNAMQNDRDTLSAQLDQTLAELSEQIRQTGLAANARDMCLSDSNEKSLIIQDLQSELKRVSDDRAMLQSQLNQMKNEFLNMLERLP